MEAVRGYYDGHAVIPLKPLRAKKNQAVIITVLDEVRDERLHDRALIAIERSYGMFAGTDLSSEDFMARKAYEKSLEL